MHPINGLTQIMVLQSNRKLPWIPHRQSQRNSSAIVCNFLYYAYTVYCTTLSALNSIAEKQAHPTQNTEAVIKHLMNYAATNNTAVIQFKASEMVLQIKSDASYLSKPWACSRTEGKY